MLGPKQERYAEQLHELAREGRSLIDEFGAYPHMSELNEADLTSWIVRTTNIMEVVFGKSSVHYRHYEDIITQGGTERFRLPYLIGVLEAGHSDLRNGFLIGQEFLIASEIFDSVLDQAKHLQSAGYKDPAAVLARVVLEDALKRLARANGVDDSPKASIINQELQKAGVYQQHQGRLVQSRLDIGNNAAHGEFDKFTHADVAKMITDIEHFLAFHFTA